MLTLVEGLTIASLTLAFYAFFANLLAQREDNFSKFLLIILFVNITVIVYVVSQMLYRIYQNQFVTTYDLFQPLTVTWYLAGLIAIFYIVNTFILSLKSSSIKKSHFKRYLYIIFNYVAVFFILYYVFGHYTYENNIMIPTILLLLFFLYLNLIDLSKSKKTVVNNSKNNLNGWGIKGGPNAFNSSSWRWIKEELKSLNIKNLNGWWVKKEFRGKAATVLIVFCWISIIIVGLYTYAWNSVDIYGLNYDSSGSATINVNNTTTKYVVHGFAEPGTKISVNSEILNITNQPINVDSNNRFNYTIDIPVNVNEAKINFYANNELKDKNIVLTIKRPYDELNESQYKAYCQLINIKEIKKNVNKYHNQMVKYQGTIANIWEGNGEAVMVVDINGKSKDKLYVHYYGNTPALDNSTVTIYGKVDKEYTFKSEDGHDILMPYINAEYIDVK